MVGSANLNIMIKAARRAGRSLVKDFREVENLQASMKGAGDFVSRAKSNVESILKEELMGARPTYGWLAELDGETEGQDPTRRWIVGPLDGTTNYLHGLPHWAVSFALEHKGQVIAGIVFDPAKDEMFFAEKGAGAWMNDGRLRVSGRSRMIDCVFATGLPHAGRVDLPETLKDLGRILPACGGVRHWGAPALNLAYVAAGRFDGFWERRLKPWEAAAGVIILREAGGLAEPITPTGDIVTDGAIVCANEPIFSPLAKLVRG